MAKSKKIVMTGGGTAGHVTPNIALMPALQEAGYEIKTGKYISFRAEGQERFTRSKTIGENYTEERIKERIAGRTPRRSQRQATPKGISLIGDIQERIRLIDSKGYEYTASDTIAFCGARYL